MIYTLKEKVKKLKTNLNVKRTLSLIWSIAPGWTVISITLVVLESVLFFASLYLLKILINEVAQHRFSKDHVLVYYVLAAGLAGVLYAVVKSVSSYTTEAQAAKVTEYIDDKIHACAVDLDLSFYESPAYFDILKRAKEAGPDHPNSVVINLVDTAKNLMMLLALGSVLLSIDWFLLPLLILFVLPTMFVRINFSEKLHAWRIRQTSMERKSLYLSGLITTDTSAKEIRSLGLGEYLRSLYLTIRLNLLSERLLISRKSTINEILTTILATVAFFSCIAYITHGVETGKTSVGDITLFLVVFPQSFSQMQGLSGCITRLYQNNIFVTNIFDLFDLKPILADNGHTVGIPEGGIDVEIKNVYFGYPHAENLVLSDINVKIPSGKIVAIVGLNGSGKTTLIKLLSRLYDPVSGTIDINGIDIRKFNMADYRKQISVVFQDFGRYNFTVSDNIKFGNIDGAHTEEDIVEAARRSGAHGYIKNFSNGYNTMMGRLFDDGHEVSIGQWQKLAIARALYSPARLLILDEATSALDALAEREFFQSFRERIGSRAALVISHRVSAVEHADYIYVLSDGEVKQSGTHEQLLQMQGDYARLFGKDTLQSNPV
jgi:ATP-binding cassette subfamily B protein